jgi:hypothetical protein
MWPSPIGLNRGSTMAKIGGPMRTWTMDEDELVTRVGLILVEWHPGQGVAGVSSRATSSRRRRCRTALLKFEAMKVCARFQATSRSMTLPPWHSTFMVD